MMAPGGNGMKGADLRSAGRGSIRSISLTASFFAGAPLEAAGWIALAIYLVLVVGFAWNPTPFAQGLAALGVAIACTHAALFYGWRNALVLLAICLATTFTMENIGAATGFPFGHYHFEVGSNLIHVGAIPIIVGPLWFGMGYISRGSWPERCLAVQIGV
jgi:uncharacterized membrane protein